MNKFSTHKWENYLKKSKVERSLTWIIDSYGINWDYVGRHQNQQGILCEEYRASPFSTRDTVTVVKQREEKEISNSFYVHFMDLDINDMEKTMNFMVSYGVDQAEYYPYDAVSGSRLFTVDHFRTYHQDFRESALFLLNELQSSADKLEKAVFQSIRKDKLSGGRSSGWEKDVRTITNDIEKHLKRCDFRLDYKKSRNGYQYYTDIKPADLIALAYYQLAKKLSLPKKHSWRECVGCGRPFECSRANNTYCDKTCKKNAADRRYQESLKNDPEKLKAVRENRNEYMREYRKL